MSLIIEDNFTHPLVNHTPDIGGAWQDAGGGAGYLQGVQPNDTFHVNDAVFPSPDYTVTLDIACIGQPPGTMIYAIGRWNGDDTGPYYAAVVSIASNGKKLSLIKVIGAQQTDLAEAVLNDNPQTLILTFAGSDITADCGEAQVSVTDSSITAAGKAGFYGNGNADPRNGIRIIKMTAG